MHLQKYQKKWVHIFICTVVGGVRKLLPNFISAGAEVLDPIQTRASGMSPEGLKKDFGQLITFCGAMDEELLLRQGTPKQVKDGVNELLDVMAPWRQIYSGDLVIKSKLKLRLKMLLLCMKQQDNGNR